MGSGRGGVKHLSLKLRMVTDGGRGDNGVPRLRVTQGQVLMASILHKARCCEICLVCGPKLVIFLKLAFIKNKIEDVS